MLAQWDVVLLQETWLIPDQETQLMLPPGYDCFACSRPCSESLCNQRGGVLVLFRTDLPVPVRQCSGPSLQAGSDLLLLHVGDILLANVYLPPAGSPWDPDPRTTPEQRLQEILLPYAVTGTPMALLGDFNARLGARYHTLPRSSPDERCLPRGSALVDMCDDLGLEILNGSQYHLATSRHSFTSFQAAGSSVIDLALVSASLLDDETPPLFDVLSRREDWSDHAPVTLTFVVREVPEPTETAWLPQALVRALPEPAPALQPVDVHLRHLLRHVMPQTLEDLYGPVWSSTPPLQVYLAASVTIGADGVPIRMGAGAYAGPAHPLTRPLPMSGPASRMRALVAAALAVITDADPTRTLRLWTAEPYLPHAVCHWALQNASRDWNCQDGDLLQHLACVLRARAAPVSFYLIEPAKHATNPAFRLACDLAEQALEHCLVPGTCLPELPATVPAGWPERPSNEAQHLRLSKVHTPLQPVSMHARSQLGDETPAQRAQLDDLLPEHLQDLPPGAHGVRRENLRRVLYASSEASFWPAFRAFTDDKPRPARVTLRELEADFIVRMNPPAVLPEGFNELERALNRITARSLPRRTQDTTSDRFFSRPFSLTEIDEVKQHIRTHNMRSAQGPDGVDYRAILACPSDELRGLFQLCVDTCTAPQDWLRATVAAIKKPRKDGGVAEHYRTIGLESCALKVLTLLIERRLRAWAEATGRIPPTQSGFRKHHRTQNPAFILRALIEKARAMGRSLLVVFLDLKNAFPSVDQPTLWAKLARWGAAGPLLDWLRMLYSHLSYVVRFQGQTSDEAFHAAAGILIGDPASPILWILFISDFDLPYDPDDITLDGVTVSNIWLADDAMLASTTTRSVQAKLAYFEVYCGDNSLTISVPKTNAAIFGPVPDPPPVLYLQRKSLAFVESAAYTGITVTSSARNIFKLHYSVKEKAARRVANGALAMEQFIGPLPPPIALRMYRALVEPHLTFGCEVVLDVQPSVLEPLEKIEVAFVRRALSLGSQCQMAPLYIDTGLWPLRYRRLSLALRYLEYALGTDGPELLRAAFHESFALATRSPAHGGPAPSWWSDLYLALAALPVPVHALTLHELPTVPAVRRCLLSLEHSLYDALSYAVLSSARLPALQARLRRPQPPSSLSALCAQRTYLSLPNARLREALVRLVCSEHPLAVEVLRRLPEDQAVPRTMRVCRFCRRRGSVEDEPHVLLSCSAPCIRDLRALFYRTADGLSPVCERLRRRWHGWRLLDLLLSCDELLRPLAEFVHAVFQLCETTPMLVLRDLDSYCSSTVP